MKPAEVVKRMKRGEELVNRGTGWYIAPPRRPYAPFQGKLVEDSAVGHLVAAGVIRVEIPSLSARAHLNPTPA